MLHFQAFPICKCHIGVMDYIMYTEFANKGLLLLKWLSCININYKYIYGQIITFIV